MEKHNDKIFPRGDKPLFLSITADIIDKTDFESAIGNTIFIDYTEYTRLFLTTAELSVADGLQDQAAVYSALGNLCQFLFRPNDISDPYGPWLTAEHQRSAVPEDFRSVAHLVAIMAEAAKDAPLKARLSDVAWLLDRSRVDLGLAAISAYSDTVKDVVSGKRKFRHTNETTPVCGQVHKLLKRALCLANMRTVGRGRKAGTDLNQYVNELLCAALAGKHIRGVIGLAKLALEYDLMPADEVGKLLDDWLTRNELADNIEKVDFLRLSASAYHRSGSTPDFYRCKLRAVETLERMATAAEASSALFASLLLADALNELHGIPDVRERRIELRHRLVQVQVGISEEMTSFRHEIDLPELIQENEDSFSGLCLRDMLFGFADMSCSPSPEQLRTKASEAIAARPLASLFRPSVHDRDGKVRYTSQTPPSMSAPNGETLKLPISQSESFRRQIFAAGDIQPVRRIINERATLTDDLFLKLLRYSEFVPNELIHTYSRGFRRFFQGDPVSGIYILTPLLESSIRHVLKTRGHDVSTFNSADKTQQDLSISAIFERMKPEILRIFGEAIVADIESVFLNQPGPQIRHQIAHGLLTDEAPYDPDSTYACWFIFRLCMIPLFPIRDKIDRSVWQQ